MNDVPQRMPGAAYRIVENARLDARNTFGIAAKAPMLVEVADTAALPELFGYAMLRDGPVLVLGGGSNLLFAGDAPGVVLSLSAAADRLLRGDKARLTADRVGYMCHPNWLAHPARAVPPSVWQPRIDTPTGLAATAQWYRQNNWL